MKKTVPENVKVVPPPHMARDLIPAGVEFGGHSIWQSCKIHVHVLALIVLEPTHHSGPCQKAQLGLLMLTRQ